MHSYAVYNKWKRTVRAVIWSQHINEICKTSLYSLFVFSCAVIHRATSLDLKLWSILNFYSLIYLFVIIRSYVSDPRTRVKNSEIFKKPTFVWFEWNKQDYDE